MVRLFSIQHQTLQFRQMHHSKGGVPAGWTYGRGGRWSLAEQNLHINHLELLSVYYALQALVGHLRNLHIHVHLQVDNMTVMSYISHKGGTHSQELSRLAVKIWTWCLHRGITLSVEFLPGVKNIVAHEMSRNFNDHTQWHLLPEIFEEIVQELDFRPSVDLFASRLNKQLPKFVSWHPDPQAWQVDAFTISWNNLTGYLFPPFTLLSWCLQKVRVEKATVLLIAPVWRTQPWYPLILELAIQTPFLLSQHPDLLQLCHNYQPHPMRNVIPLAAWVLSGNRWQQEAFHRKCPQLSCHHGEKVQMLSSTRHGVAGVFNDNLI